MREESGGFWLCDTLDAIVKRVGAIVWWFIILLILTIVTQVFLRYGLRISLVGLEEMQSYLYGFTMIFAVPYALVLKKHVRIDIFSRNFTPRTKNLIEFFGITLFLLPTIFVIFFHSLHFVVDSWRVNERSTSPLGLPCLWIFKSAIPAGMILLFLAALSQWIQAARAAFGRKPGKANNGRQ